MELKILESVEDLQANESKWLHNQEKDGEDKSKVDEILKSDAKIQISEPTEVEYVLEKADIEDAFLEEFKNMSEKFGFSDSTGNVKDDIKKYDSAANELAANSAANKKGDSCFVVNEKDRLASQLIRTSFTGFAIIDNDGSGITMELEMQSDGNPNMVLDIGIRFSVVTAIQVKNFVFIGVCNLIFKPLVMEFPCFGAVSFFLREMIHPGKWIKDWRIAWILEDKDLKGGELMHPKNKEVIIWVQNWSSTSTAGYG